MLYAIFAFYLVYRIYNNPKELLWNNLNKNLLQVSYNRYCFPRNVQLIFQQSLKKNAQHNMAYVFECVPQQDFSKPWTDEELYAKYGLTEEEIAFIESMIKPMELGGED